MVPTVLNSYVTQQDSGRSELYFEVLTCHIFATSIKHIFQYNLHWFFTWQFGKSPVFFDVSPIESSQQKWWISQLAMFGTASRSGATAGLYWSLPCIRSATFREIHWVSLSDLCSWRCVWTMCRSIFHEPTIWANLSRQVKIIFERLLEWLFLHSHFCTCCVAWSEFMLGPLGFWKRSLPSFPKLQHGARNGARVGRVASRAARCARGAT